MEQKIIEPKLVSSGLSKFFSIEYKGKTYHIDYTNADTQTLALVNRDYWEVTDEEGESVDISEEDMEVLINFCIEHFADYENELKKNCDSLKRIE